MARTEAATIGRDLRRIFDGESLAGLSDGELLDRFARRGDGAEGAFRALVDRHGSAVLRACRGFGGDDGSAEDAFQATFVVLARKAGSVRVGDSLRPWLLGVARRTARKSRVGELRRKARERKVAVPESLGVDRPGFDEIAPIVRAEVDRLPSKFRDPVRLFYLEGRTQEETAEALGWPVGSVSGRLFQARKLLRERLAHRGVAPLGAMVGIPRRLLASTLACSLAGPEPSGAVASLATRVIRSMAWAKFGAQAVGLTLAILAVGAGLAPLLGPQGPPPLPTLRAPLPSMVAPIGRVDRHGDPLPDGAIARMGTSRFRQSYFEDGHAMARAFYSRDGRALVTVGSLAGVSTWDSSTGRKLRRIDARQAALSPDGRTLATAKPGVVQLWDFPGLRERTRASKEGEDYRRLAFSPEGSTLVAIADAPGTSALVAFETDGLGERFRREGDYRKARALAFAPDGRGLALATLDEPGPSTVRVLDPSDGSERRRIAVDRLAVSSIAFAPDGRTLAVGVGDRTIRLYDWATGREDWPRLGADRAIARLDLDDSPVDGSRGPATLAFSPDGRTLASGLDSLDVRVGEGSITLWDVAGRREIGRSSGQDGGVSEVAFAPDGKTFASSGGEPVAKVWDAATGLEVDPRPGHRGDPRFLAVSPLDGTIYTGGAVDARVLRWDPSTGRCLEPITGLPANLLGLDVSPDGSTLLVDTWDGLILWDPAAGREVRRFLDGRRSHFGAIGGRFSPDGRSVTTELKVWETSTGRLLASFADSMPDWPVSPFCAGARYTPDSRRLVSVETRGVRMLDIASSSVAGTRWPSTIANPGRATLSHDGRVVAVGNFGRTMGDGPLGMASDLTVRAYELASGRVVLELEGLADQVAALAFSPDGRTLATGSGDIGHPKDRTVRVWDAITGRELKRFDVSENGAVELAYLPDGRGLVTLGMDGAALIWDVSGLAPRVQTGPTFEALWEDLASDDAPKAYRASWALAVPEALAFLLERLPKGGDRLRLLRGVAAIERIGTPEARAALRRLEPKSPR